MTSVVPQDVAAEESVLGAMLLSPTAVAAVACVLEVTDFYRKSHATMYATALELFRSGQPVDLISLADRLERDGKLDEVGGRPRIAELAAIVPAAANAVHHARIVRRFAVERQEIRIGQRLARREIDRRTAMERLEALGSGAPHGEADSWTPVDLGCLASAEPPLPSVFGIFYPGREHLLSGAPETGKTWVTLAAAASVICSGRRVLLMDFESGGHEVVTRLSALGLTDAQIEAGLALVVPDEPIASPRRVLDLIASEAPTLVVVDSYTPALELHGCDPDRGADIERFGRLVLNPLRSGGAAVVVVDHIPKKPGKNDRYPIGSERKLARTDVHLGVTANRTFQRGRASDLNLVTRKDRVGQLARPSAGVLHLRSDSVGQVRPELEVASMHVRAEPSEQIVKRTLAFLETQTEPISRSKAEQGIQGNTAEIRRAIDWLVARRRIVETRGASRARLIELAHGSTTDEDGQSVQVSDPGNATCPGTSPNLVHFSTSGSSVHPDHQRPSPYGEGVVGPGCDEAMNAQGTVG